ncbi:MAG: hypothetical protein IRY85_08120 [Micromonosporaceae bacterium]|nr:hypothetical protein [Micromonosporaceae bacterium]
MAGNQREEGAHGLGVPRGVDAVAENDWIGAAGRATPRINDPNNFVRIEIEMAYQLGIPVVPVQVDGAPMPRSDQVPESIAKMTRIKAFPVRSTSFRADCGALAAYVRKLLADPLPRPVHSKAK